MYTVTDILLYIFIIISAVERPVLDIRIPNRPQIGSIGSGLHPPQTQAFNQSSVHLVTRRPTPRLPFDGFLCLNVAIFFIRIYDAPFLPGIYFMFQFAYVIRFLITLSTPNIMFCWHSGLLFHPFFKLKLTSNFVCV